MYKFAVARVRSRQRLHVCPDFDKWSRNRDEISRFTVILKGGLSEWERLVLSYFLFSRRGIEYAGNFAGAIKRTSPVLALFRLLSNILPTSAPPTLRTS